MEGPCAAMCFPGTLGKRVWLAGVKRLGQRSMDGCLQGGSLRTRRRNIQNAIMQNLQTASNTLPRAALPWLNKEQDSIDWAFSQWERPQDTQG